MSSKFLFGIFFSENHFYQNLKYYTSMYVHSSYIKDDDSYFIIKISIMTDMVEKYIHFLLKKKKKKIRVTFITSWFIYIFHYYQFKQCNHLQHFLFASLPVYTTIDTIGFWTVLGKFVEFEIDVSTGLPLNYLSHFFQHIQKIKDGHHFTKNINRIPLGKC